MEKKISNTLSFFAAINYSDKIWCSNLNFNGLFTIDMATDKVEYIGRFIGYDANSVGLHSAVELYEDRLIFFPNRASSIDSYDFAGNFYCCEINSWKKAKQSNSATGLSGAYLWGDKYYIFPKFPGMNLIKFSPKNNEICEEIELQLANEVPRKNNSRLTHKTVRVKNDVYLPVTGSNVVIKYNLENDHEEKIVLHEIDCIQGAMNFDGSSFWVNSDRGISRYDSAFKKRISFYHCAPEKEGFIREIVFNDNMVFALPTRFGAIKVIDSASNSLQQISIDAADMKLLHGPVSKWRHTENSICFDDFFMINPVSLNSALIMDYHTLEITEKIFEVPFESVPMHYESSKDDLEDFIQLICNTPSRY